MLEGQPEEITHLLKRMAQGDKAAESLLFEAVYANLKQLARLFLSQERQEHTLQPTALVNEAFLRLPRGALAWQDRQHFYALAARAMRRILVDHAIARGAQKRPEGKQRVDMTESFRYNAEDPITLLAIDQALLRLAEMDPRQAQIVEMRFFGGLTEEEIAEVLAISVRTVKREWKVARIWLYDQLRDEGDEGDAGTVPVLKH